MVKDVVVSNDGTITCDKKRRPGGAPELICRRCYQRVAISTADAKNYKWQDVVNAHTKKRCTPPQDSWQYRANARAVEAPELRGLVFVARGCVDTEMCAAAVKEVKQFPEKSWGLVDPREDGEGMCDNRRQRVVRQGRAKRGTVKIRDAGKLVVQELSEARARLCMVDTFVQKNFWCCSSGTGADAGIRITCATRTASGRRTAQRGSFVLRRGGICPCLALAIK